MGTTAEKLNKLLETKADIKAAIIDQGQVVSDADTFSSYGDKIRSIETGKDVSCVTAGAGDVRSGKIIVDSAGAKVVGSLAENSSSAVEISGTKVTIPAGIYDEPVSVHAGTDTSDATAMASDMASGVTAYVNGEKVTGNVTTVAAGTSISPGTVTLSQIGSNVGMYNTFAFNVLVRKDAKVYSQAALSEFGNASASDVAAGKTFTSSAGLKVTGTAATSAAPCVEAVVIEATTTAGLATFTTSKSISKVCSITFIVESPDYYGKNTFLYLLQADGKLARFSAAAYSSAYYIVEDSNSLASGETISGQTVTYGVSTSSGWKTRLPAGSYVYGTITYIPS